MGIVKIFPKSILMNILKHVCSKVCEFEDFVKGWTKTNIKMPKEPLNLRENGKTP